MDNPHDEIDREFQQHNGPDSSVESDCSSGQWISVLDRMPSLGDAVLVFGRKTYGSATILILEDRFAESWLSAYWCQRGGGAVAHPYDADGRVSAKDISHWMPLPEPPCLDR